MPFTSCLQAALKTPAGIKLEAIHLGGMDKESRDTGHKPGDGLKAQFAAPVRDISKRLAAERSSAKRVMLIRKTACGLTTVRRIDVFKICERRSPSFITREFTNLLAKAMGGGK